MKPKKLPKQKPSLQASYKVKSRKISNTLKCYSSKLSKSVRQNVLYANSIEDVLKPEILEKCETDTHKNFWKVESYSSLSIQKEVLLWALELIKTNVRQMYEDTVGWDEEGKFKEMTHPAAKYIIIRDENSNKLLAFSNFRFDVDYSEEVLYCYELHVISEERSKGIGKFLLSLLETLSMTYKMKKVILTVFNANKSAIKFYKKNGYEEDRTSPVGKSYIILSKYVTSGNS